MVYQEQCHHQALERPPSRNSPTYKEDKYICHQLIMKEERTKFLKELPID
jgi:hypothetical protein